MIWTKVTGLLLDPPCVQLYSNNLCSVDASFQLNDVRSLQQIFVLRQIPAIIVNNNIAVIRQTADWVTMFHNREQWQRPGQKSFGAIWPGETNQVRSSLIAIFATSSSSSSLYSPKEHSVTNSELDSRAGQHGSKKATQIAQRTAVVTTRTNRDRSRNSWAMGQ